jgi:uncharacterized membrane-anchored protein
MFVPLAYTKKHSFNLHIIHGNDTVDEAQDIAQSFVCNVSFR